MIGRWLGVITAMLVDRSKPLSLIILALEFESIDPANHSRIYRCLNHGLLAPAIYMG